MYMCFKVLHPRQKCKKSNYAESRFVTSKCTSIVNPGQVEI
jgi:hypothetical protein